MKLARKYQTIQQTWGGFTLTELGISLGLAGLMLLPLAGLLATSMSVERQASDLVVARQVAADMLGRLARDHETRALVLRGASGHLVLHRPEEVARETVLLMEGDGKVMEQGREGDATPSHVHGVTRRVTVVTRWNGQASSYYSISVSVEDAGKARLPGRKRDFLTKVYAE